MNEQIIKQLIKAWEAQNKTITTFFTKYEDDFYLNEIAPGRNRAIYVLGHLIAVNDSLLTLLGLGERLFPELEPFFIRTPDGTVAGIPSITTLKEQWTKLNQTLRDHFAKMTPEEWLQRHTMVAEEDFALDPLRNKLNVLISRTNHESYHAGQLALLNPR
jgi:hypothetical protein